MKATIPPVAAKLADVIGSDNTMALLHHARCDEGRRFVRVPLRPRRGQVIVELIGMEAAAKLSNEYGGRVIHLPKLKAIDRAQRDAEIKRMAAEGLSKAEIASRFGITARQVGNLLAA